MKNILLILISLFLLGILIFLGLIFFSSDSGSESPETGETASADDNESVQMDSKEEKNEEKDSDEEDNTEVLSAEGLERDLSTQEVVIKDVQYLIQDNQLKSLYPDMLSAVFENNSTDDIKDITFGFVAWDENGLPIKIKGDIDFSDGRFFYEGTGQSVNISPGETYGYDYGFEIDSDINDYHYYKAVVTEYTGFNGEKWRNPLLADFKNIYEGKRLVDIEGNEETVFSRFGGQRTDSNEAAGENHKDDRDRVESFINDYFANLENAYATGDFSYIEDYLSSDTSTYITMRNNVEENNFPNMKISSVRVTNYTEDGNTIYMEVLSERMNDHLNQPAEYKTGYHIIKQNGGFKIETYEDL